MYTNNLNDNSTLELRVQTPFIHLIDSRYENYDFSIFFLEMNIISTIIKANSPPYVMNAYYNRNIGELHTYITTTETTIKSATTKSIKIILKSYLTHKHECGKTTAI